MSKSAGGSTDESTGGYSSPGRLKLKSNTGVWGNLLEYQRKVGSLISLSLFQVPKNSSTLVWRAIAMASTVKTSTIDVVLKTSARVLCIISLFTLVFKGHQISIKVSK